MSDSSITSLRTLRNSNGNKNLDRIPLWAIVFRASLIAFHLEHIWTDLHISCTRFSLLFSAFALSKQFQKCDAIKGKTQPFGSEPSAMIQIDVYKRDLLSMQ